MSVSWKCPNCGTNENIGNFCSECGAKRPEAETWDCPNCGNTGIKSKFCPECGAKKPDSGVWTCPNCGTKDISGKFCPECGTKRGDAAAPCTLRQEQKQEEKQSKQEKNCENCGKIFDEDFNFCPCCGKFVMEIKAEDIVDHDDYIELKKPIGNIHMIEKTCLDESLSWVKAVEYAQNLKLGDFDDWRIPTKEELEIIYKIKDSCGISRNNNWFWSSSTKADNAEKVWIVNFEDGCLSSIVKTYSYFVLCVR